MELLPVDSPVFVLDSVRLVSVANEEVSVDNSVPLSVPETSTLDGGGLEEYWSDVGEACETDTDSVLSV